MAGLQLLVQPLLLSRMRNLAGATLMLAAGGAAQAQVMTVSSVPTEAIDRRFAHGAKLAQSAKGAVAWTLQME